MLKTHRQIKTRFAPSPTGAPHVGNVRTALFAWLFARSSGGVFVLRIEDTDQDRFDKDSVKKILESLKWLGLDIDEGLADVDIERGESGPYIQSKRADIYKKYAEKLVDSSRAFYCFCSQDRLDKLRDQQKKEKKPPKYDGHCLRLSNKEIQDKLKAGEKYTIRMNVPEPGSTSFNDEIKGEISFANNTIDHQVLIKSDGHPTYHLASVVDDHLMGITHVIRADEWLASTPKHVLLYKYFGWKEPTWVHLPIILGPDKSKLSKRHGAVSVLEYRDQGYLPSAVVNYLALLGWNPKTEQEIFSTKELIEKFDLKKINKNNPVFDVTKLNWINHQHILKLSINEIIDLLGEKYAQIDIGKLRKAVVLVQDRMERITDFENLSSFIWKLPEYDPQILIPKKSNRNQAQSHLKTALRLIQEENEWNEDDLRKTFLGHCESHQLKRGEFLWPLRVAVTGMEKSPETFAVMDVLGREETERRINIAIKKF